MQTYNAVCKKQNADERKTMKTKTAEQKQVISALRSRLRELRRDGIQADDHLIVNCKDLEMLLDLLK